MIAWSAIADGFRLQLNPSYEFITQGFYY